MELTQAYLKTQFHYDPDTGFFSRLVAHSNKSKVGDVVGCPDSNGYLRTVIDGKFYTLHRLAFLYMDGGFPKCNTDHIDGNPSNNAWQNLRDVTQADNSKNAKLPTTNKSGTIGVSWNKHRGKWSAQIQINGRKKHIGLFYYIGDAIAARKDASSRYGFHPNHGRAP